MKLAHELFIPQYVCRMCVVAVARISGRSTLGLETHGVLFRTKQTESMSLKTQVVKNPFTIWRVFRCPDGSQILMMTSETSHLSRAGEKTAICDGYMSCRHINTPEKH